jgi:hypothetical protein
MIDGKVESKMPNRPAQPKTKFLFLIAIFLLFAGSWLGGAVLMRVQDEEAIRIWKEFVTDLRAGKMENPERYRLLNAAWNDSFVGWMKILREGVDWNKTKATPEIFRVGDEIKYVVPVWQKAEDGLREHTYCFTLILENGRWYYRHLESITIRLDKVKNLPASEFPDVPEERKAWIRNESETSDAIRLFNFLAKEKGKDFAYDWFKDGPGYVVAACAWVPFFPKERAFVLFMCWQLANLRGENVTLEKLDEKEALVRWTKPLFFELYARAAHIKTWVSVEDYRRLFETIWQSRAAAAGWNLAIAEEGDALLMRFTR